MNKLEIDSAKRKKKHDIQKVILNIVSNAGLISLALIAPKTIRYLKDYGLDPRERQKEIIKKSKDRLIKKGLLEYKDGFLKITEKGQSELNLFEMKDFGKVKPKKWDGRWRVLIFDIPEKRKLLREKVRNTFIDIGFVCLQDSVWMYPYDCEDFVNLLKADFKVGKDLLYLIVDTLENDKQFRKYFDLPEYNL